ncbi:hypothetical protein [Pedosphaera parvula]|uniref:Uncharacterized protein n=1 Tax=Pedosphaera parvula (strain Ellin514) TaxID=320771 RepID=B9XK21_PEDPL|nr:hypothetical protein [Pedosphaera parvula]EEF59844.1 hypothetical protein Cflav_PD2851 [Pedosphaera parvula Ellin514]
MNPPDTDDPLDLLLKEQETYVEDCGFTARVMMSLPKRKRVLTFRVILLSGSALLGLVLAAWFLRGTEILTGDQSGPGFPLLTTLLGLLPLVVVAIAIIWGVVSGFNEEG